MTASCLKHRLSHETAGKLSTRSMCTTDSFTSSPQEDICCRIVTDMKTADKAHAPATCLLEAECQEEALAACVIQRAYRLWRLRQLLTRAASLTSHSSSLDAAARCSLDDTANSYCQAADGYSQTQVAITVNITPWADNDCSCAMLQPAAADVSQRGSVDCDMLRPQACHAGSSSSCSSGVGTPQRHVAVSAVATSLAQRYLIVGGDAAPAPSPCGISVEAISSAEAASKKLEKKSKSWKSKAKGMLKQWAFWKVKLDKSSSSSSSSSSGGGTGGGFAGGDAKASSSSNSLGVHPALLAQDAAASYSVGRILESFRTSPIGGSPVSSSSSLARGATTFGHPPSDTTRQAPSVTSSCSSPQFHLHGVTANTDAVRLVALLRHQQLPRTCTAFVPPPSITAPQYLAEVHTSCTTSPYSEVAAAPPSLVSLDATIALAFHSHRSASLNAAISAAFLSQQHRPPAAAAAAAAAGHSRRSLPSYERATSTAVSFGRASMQSDPRAVEGQQTSRSCYQQPLANDLRLAEVQKASCSSYQQQLYSDHHAPAAAGGSVPSPNKTSSPSSSLSFRQHRPASSDIVRMSIRPALRASSSDVVWASSLASGGARRGGSPTVSAGSPTAMAALSSAQAFPSQRPTLIHNDVTWTSLNDSSLYSTTQGNGWRYSGQQDSAITAGAAGSIPPAPHQCPTSVPPAGWAGQGTQWRTAAACPANGRAFAVSEAPHLMTGRVGELRKVPSAAGRHPALFSVPSSPAAAKPALLSFKSLGWRSTLPTVPQDPSDVTTEGGVAEATSSGPRLSP